MAGVGCSARHDKYTPTEPVLYPPQLSTIADLRNSTLRRRHWEAIERQLGHQLLDLDEQTPLTLQLLIDYRAFSWAEQIKEVSGQASSEASLETLLGKVSRPEIRGAGTFRIDMPNLVVHIASCFVVILSMSHFSLILTPG